MSTEINFDFNFSKITEWLEKNIETMLLVLLCVVSLASFIFFYRNGLGLAYNDARSHLDIGRRVVEGLKPGLAQIGSVWLPLNHLLMVPTIWNDFMWHSGLSGAIQSMISYVVVGLLIYTLLKKLGTGILGRLVAVFVFASNLNILYLQSTAMTELLLLSTMTAGVYYLMAWAKDDELLSLIKSAFWIMLSTLVRYDGWFLLVFVMALITITSIKEKGYRVAEGIFVLFGTLAAVGVAAWFLWNQLIFKDVLYFALGPFSAHAQQQQLTQAGVLATKGNLWLSLKTYLYSLAYNSYTFTAVLGAFGAIVFWLDKKFSPKIRIISVALIAPLIFNVLALYLGFSVLYVQGIFGTSWFNVRYGIMLLPTIAIFAGYLIDRVKPLRFILVGLILLVTFFSLANFDAVTVDDARVGSSQKNVSEVSGYLNNYAKNEKGFILISAASHDAIIFSSGLPMKRFIHEGTGLYWKKATANPDHWARWIVMRTYDQNDLTYRLVSKSSGLAKYHLVAKYPFADVYELDRQYLGQLITDPILANQK